ncbi:MAG: hypothetical protein ACTHNW_06765 [Mucilaginibacter sp.]
MRKFLMVILPPFIGIAGYFIAVRYSGVYFQLRTDEMGEGTVQSFMAYYRYFLPLLFVVAVLTQAVIVLPIWNKVLNYQRLTSKLVDLISLVYICLLFAGGISYLITDPQHNLHHFVHVSLFMTFVQLGYWMIDLLLLYLLSPKKGVAVTETEKEIEE